MMKAKNVTTMKKTTTTINTRQNSNYINICMGKVRITRSLHIKKNKYQQQLLMKLKKNQSKKK